MFSDSDIHDAVSQAVTAGIVPADKTRALVVQGDTTNGIEAVFAQKVGDHWQFGGDAEWHGGGDFSAGAQVVASW